MITKKDVYAFIRYMTEHREKLIPEDRDYSKEIHCYSSNAIWDNMLGSLEAQGIFRIQELSEIVTVLTDGKTQWTMDKAFFNKIAIGAKIKNWLNENK